MTASLAGTYLAYPCEGAQETEVEAAGTSDSYKVASATRASLAPATWDSLAPATRDSLAPATRNSLGMLSRMALMIGFIGHLYLANWQSHFKGLFSHVLNVTSWRTDHHLLSNHSHYLPLKNFFTPLTPIRILNTDGDHFDLSLLCHPILYMTLPIACSVVASAQGGLSRGSCLAASKVEGA